jgi:hypothetical protein
MQLPLISESQSNIAILLSPGILFVYSANYIPEFLINQVETSSVWP